VLFMVYLLPKGFPNGNSSIDFVNKLSSILPVLERIREGGGYDNYWGLFYAVFWLISPIYWILGFVGASLLNEEQQKKLIYDLSKVRIFAIFSLTSLGVFYIFEFPVSLPGILPNQMSCFVLKLIFSWLYTALCIYAQATMVYILIAKFRLI